MLPDDDYPAATLCGHPVWRPDDPDVMGLDHYYKKLRVFWGPAERFVYVDADQLALHDPSPLLRHLAATPGEFFTASMSSRRWAQWSTCDMDVRKHTISYYIGNVEQLRGFAPTYDPFAAFPFSSGNWAASRDVFDRPQLLAEFHRAQEYDRAVGNKPPMTRSRRAVFNGDQGFLNYMVWKHGVEMSWITDFCWWGGDPESLWYSVGDVPSQPFTGMFVHWAGCPRPAPVPMPARVPRASQWRRHYYHHCWRHRDFRGLLKDTADFVALAARETLSRIKSKVMP